MNALHARVHHAHAHYRAHRAYREIVAKWLDPVLELARTALVLAAVITLLSASPIVQ